MEELCPPATPHDENGRPLSLYACTTCARRKVRCDKSTPICTACRKSRVECQYIDPQNGKKRRRPPSEYHSKSKNAHDLHKPPPSPKTASEEFFGKLVSNPKSGSTRYVHSNIWMSLNDDLHPSSDEEHEGDFPENVKGAVPSALPISAASQPVQIDLQTAQAQTPQMWSSYVQNVDPIIKLVHVPSTAKMIGRVTTDLSSITKSEECLLYTMFTLATLSTTEAQCFAFFGHAKQDLIQGYHDAARSALARCALMKTTKFAVLQAYVILLVSLRDTSDASTFWLETGIAMRIAQRMGLHRAAANAVHGPFDEQMRLRLWWTLMSLDKIAGQLAGTGMPYGDIPWDTELPLNINDADIWPGMTAPPTERKGGSDMFFFMSRLQIGQFFMVKSPIERWGPNRRSWENLAKAIDDLEETLETRYIRYVDCSIPYQMQAVLMCRGTLSYCRLRLHILQLQGQESAAGPSHAKYTPADPSRAKYMYTAAERKQLVGLASRVVDQYIACHSNSALQIYSWHLDSSLQWDPLIWVLHELCNEEPQADIHAAWHRVSGMFEHNPIILEQKRILDVAVGRLVLKAWSSTVKRQADGLVIPEPPYIAQLEEAFRRRKAARETSSSGAVSEDATTATLHDPMVLDELAGEAADWGIDWEFWDQYLHTKDSGLLA